MTQIFLNVGVTTFPDPGNWDPVNNKVECLGAGGNGGSGYTVPHDAPVLLTNAAGGGGGGGGYGWATSLNTSFPVAVNVGAPINLGTGPSTSTWWGNSNSAPGTVIGLSGYNGGSPTGGDGGVGGGFFPNGFNGGPGGRGGGDSAGGGAGAAGPNGGGGNGLPPGGAEPNPGGLGGAGMSGLPGGGGGGNSGGAGFPGNFWDASHGPGGGGGGGAGNVAGPMPGGAGGNYGGGGGGGGASDTPQGTGAPGLLIITYTPFIPPPSGNVQIMA